MGAIVIAGCDGGPEFEAIEPPETFAANDVGPVPAEPCPALFALGGTIPADTDVWWGIRRHAILMSALRTLLAHPDLHGGDLEDDLARSPFATADSYAMVHDEQMWEQVCDRGGVGVDEYAPLVRVIWDNPDVHETLSVMVEPHLCPAGTEANCNPPRFAMFGP